MYLGGHLEPNFSNDYSHEWQNYIQKAFLGFIDSRRIAPFHLRALNEACHLCGRPRGFSEGICTIFGAYIYKLLLGVVDPSQNFFFDFSIPFPISNLPKVHFWRFDTSYTSDSLKSLYTDSVISIASH